jgi:hypothetical protein
MTRITQAAFLAATGEPPCDDDLERCNCPQAGKPGHQMCGWNAARNLPVFIAGPEGKPAWLHDDPPREWRAIFPDRRQP